MANLQWEYRIIGVDLDSPRAPQALNNAGREGWEAVSAMPQHERMMVLLKRIRTAKADR